MVQSTRRGIDRRFAIRLAAGSLLIACLLSPSIALGNASAAKPSSVTAEPMAGDRQASSTQRLVWARFHPEDETVGLITADIDGRHEHELTHPPSGVSDTDPVRSPDGRRVIFNRETADGVQIAIARVDGTGGVTIVDTGCREPCADDIDPGWTPDGRHLTFTRVIGPFDPITHDAASALLYTAREDGSHLRRLSEPGNDGSAEDNHARYAPDGKYLVFDRTRRINGTVHTAIFRMTPTGTRVQQLTAWALDATRASVSPARRGPTAGLVVFETNGVVPEAQADVATVPAACRSLDLCSAGIRLVTSNTGTSKSSFMASWSPNGQRLAYTETPGGGRAADIWTARYDGRHAFQVTRSPLSDFFPAWSF
ncbi:TolB family protein [Kribbella kalugense]|uniref:WD40 repeat protein n=1 Tax=Kribbella kalugense TaxID=2512221 RepID=A0A4R7ZZS8_9ACTN|nr:PD40 domain-containing protein [Kribbella kalugense]TDW23737.1 WD40 repeat protein [Kribbella kalugense]